MEDTYNDVWRINIDDIMKLLNGELETKDLWECIKTTGTAPEKISNHHSIVLESRIYMYGGLINNENLSSSLYIFDTTNNYWLNHKTKVNIIDVIG